MKTVLRSLLVVAALAVPALAAPSKKPAPTPTATADKADKPTAKKTASVHHKSKKDKMAPAADQPKDAPAATPTGK